MPTSPQFYAEGWHIPPLPTPTRASPLSTLTIYPNSSVGNSPSKMCKISRLPPTPPLSPSQARHQSWHSKPQSPQTRRRVVEVPSNPLNHGRTSQQEARNSIRPFTWRSRPSVRDSYRRQILGLKYGTRTGGSSDRSAAEPLQSGQRNGSMEDVYEKQADMRRARYLGSVSRRREEQWGDRREEQVCLKEFVDALGYL